MSTARAGLIASCLACLLAVPGCVMPDQLSQMQKDVSDMQQRLLRIERNQEEVERRVDTLAARPRDAENEVTRADFADMVVQLDQVSRQMAIAGERMNRTRPPLTPTPGEPESTDSLPLADPDGEVAAPVNALPDPEALYNSAYADFSKGNYALAISGFEEYQQKFTDSALADNALYWIAECHFSQGSFPAAIDALDHLLDLYPRSDKAPAGNLKKALAFLEQNQVGQAIVQLRYVASNYPGTDEARLARDKLSSLGATVD
jgi:tol-pal system protein YbgF